MKQTRTLSNEPGAVQVPLETDGCQSGSSDGVVREAQGVWPGAGSEPRAHDAGSEWRFGV